jgi:hypothetical protein
MRQYLVKQASMPWDGDLVNLRAALSGIHSNWKEIAGEDPCPISFTTEEVHMKESKEWNEAAEILGTIRDSLGIGGCKCSSYQMRRSKNVVGRYGHSRTTMIIPAHHWKP